MKKSLSLILAALFCASAFASCAADGEKALDPNITYTSSESAASAEWLDARLGSIPDKLILGTGASAQYGVDMSSFEDDGYVIREYGDEILLFGKTATGLDKAVRKYAKSVESGSEASIEETYHEGYRIKDFRIAGNPISDYSVVYDASREEFYRYGGCLNAAKEFASLTSRACGVNVPYLASDADGVLTPHHVFIRFVDNEEMREMGYAYRVEDGDLIIESPTGNGAVCAVQMFFQDECGWEDLIYGDSDLQCADLVDVPEGTKVENVPMCDYFVPYNGGGVPFANQRSIAVNGYVTNACHGQVSNAWNGFHNQWNNMCYSDPANIEGIYDDMYGNLDKRIKAGQIIGRDIFYLDMSQVDSMSFCHCKTCNAIMKEENGSNAGPIVRAANQISEWLEPDFPNVKLLNFAYHGSNIPPKTAPCDNVYFTFCTDGHCSMHYFDGSQCQGASFDFMGVMGDRTFNNNDYAKWVHDWCALTPNLYVWYYCLDNNFHQYSVIDTLYEDFKFFADAGIKGMFWQIPFHGLGPGKIEHQLGALMNWDTDMTKAEYTAELYRLLEKTYGDGWTDVLRYLDLLHEAEFNIDHCDICWNYTGVIPDPMFDIATYTANWEEMIECLDRAIAQANSAEQQKWCELLSASMLYCGIWCEYFPAYDAGDIDRIALLSDRFDLMYRRMKTNGFDPAALVGVDGNIASIHGTLEETAWLDWASERIRVAPDESAWKPMPEQYVQVEE